MFHNENSFIIPFGTFVWLICSFVAWGSYILEYKIGFVGSICWLVSLIGIGAFILGIIIWISDY